MALKFLTLTGLTFFSVLHAGADDRICNRSREEVMAQIEYLNQVRFCKNVNLESCQARLGVGALGVGGAIAGLTAAGASRATSIPTPVGTCSAGAASLKPVDSKNQFSLFWQTFELMFDQNAHAAFCIPGAEDIRRNPDVMAVRADALARAHQDEIANQLKARTASISEKLQTLATTSEGNAAKATLQEYIQGIGKPDVNQSRINEALEKLAQKNPQMKEIVEHIKLESQAIQKLRQQSGQIALMQGRLAQLSGALKLQLSKYEFGKGAEEILKAKDKYLASLKAEINQLASLGISNSQIDTIRAQMLQDFVRVESMAAAATGKSLAENAAARGAARIAEKLAAGELAEAGSRGAARFLAAKGALGAAVMGTGFIGVSAQAAVSIAEPTTLGCGGRGGPYVARDSNCKIQPGLTPALNQFLDLNSFDQTQALDAEPNLCEALNQTYAGFRSSVVGSCKSATEPQIVTRENPLFAPGTAAHSIRVSGRPEKPSYVVTSATNVFCATSSDGHNVQVFRTGQISLNQDCPGNSVQPSSILDIPTQVRAYSAVLQETNVFVARAASCCAGNSEQCEFMNMKAMANASSQKSGPTHGMRD